MPPKARRLSKGKATAAPAQKKTRTDGASGSTSTAAAKSGSTGSHPSTPPQTAPPPPPQTQSYAETAANPPPEKRAPTPRIEVQDEVMASRAASPTGEPSRTSPDHSADRPQGDQSGDRRKASSVPQGTKRKLAVPNYVMGKSLFQVAEWESYQRPPPKVPHQFVAFVSLKDLSFTAKDVIVAGAKAFGKDLVAADVFTASRQLAFAFPTAACADAAVKSGLPMSEETTLPLTRRADYQPLQRRLTVSNVDCTSPAAAVKALRAYFKPYGRVLDVTPRYWADTHVHNGVWHVTLDVKKFEINQAPPEVDVILGQDVFIDVPGFERVCRHCMSAVHSRKDCKTWQRLQAKPEALAAYERNIASDSRLAELQQARQQQQKQHQHQHQQKQKQQQQRQQQQPTKQQPTEEQQTPKEDDPEVALQRLRAAADAILQIVDDTTNSLRTFEDEGAFEAALVKALAEYETVSTAVPALAEMLPQAERLECDWREARTQWLQDLTAHRALERQRQEEAAAAATRGDDTDVAANTSFTMDDAQDLNAPVEDIISNFLNEDLASSIHAPGYVPGPADTSASGAPQVVAPTFVHPIPRTPPGVLTFQGEGLVDRGTLTSPPPPPSYPNTRSHSHQ